MWLCAHTYGIAYVCAFLRCSLQGSQYAHVSMEAHPRPMAVWHRCMQTCEVGWCVRAGRPGRTLSTYGCMNTCMCICEMFMISVCTPGIDASRTHTREVASASVCMPGFQDAHSLWLNAHLHVHLRGGPVCVRRASRMHTLNLWLHAHTHQFT
jgi:hypothetical protein